MSAAYHDSYLPLYAGPPFLSRDGALDIWDCFNAQRDFGCIAKLRCRAIDSGIAKKSNLRELYYQFGGL